MDIGLMPSPTPLELRYTELERPVLLTGIQALVRVLLEQVRQDRRAGYRTAGLVSGYRGSPLAGLDLELWHEQKMLDAFGIRFQPGLNEIIFNPSIETDGLKKITNSWQQRVWENQLFADPVVTRYIEDNGIIVTDWKEVMSRFRKK